MVRTAPWDLNDNLTEADAPERLPYLYDLAGNLEVDLEGIAERHPTEALPAEHMDRYNRILRAARALLPNSVALKEDVDEIGADTRADRAYHDLHTTIVPTLHNALPEDEYRARG